MPRKAAQPSLAEQHAAPGGAASVDRALSLLAAFRLGDAVLTLTDLAERTRLYKSTVLRGLASLEHAGLVQRDAGGGWCLGPEVARLGAVHAASSSLDMQLLPVMQALVARTRESAAFHVRQGDHRLCLLRVDSPQLLRDHVRAGEQLPLDRGAGGRVLLAFSGQRGRLYDQIRREGVLVRTGDRVDGLTGISAPVWGARSELVGALTLTLPEQRMQPGLVEALREAAQAATRRLGGQGPAVG